MKKVTKQVVWDQAGEKGGPIEGPLEVEVPETWDEGMSLHEGTKEDLFKAMVAQYVTTKVNNFREQVLAIPDRNSRPGLKHWFYHKCDQKNFMLHKETVEKLLHTKVTKSSKKAISRFLDKVDPVKD